MRGVAPCAALALACGLAAPEPFTRVVSAAPSGAAVPVRTAAELIFSGPVAPEGLVDGTRLVLVEAGAQRDALAAVEAEAGAAGIGVPAAVTLEDGGRRAVLTPLAPLRARTAFALVLSSRVRDAEGRRVLDASGRLRPFVAAFETGAPEGPPPVPVLTEVRAAAATPQAGGEYVELANVGEGPLELAGWRLAKRTATGALTSCALGAPVGWTLAPGGVALVAGGSWDGRYAVPAGVPVVACGATALLGGLADDRPPELLLVDPLGATAATLGAGGAIVCPEALERSDPLGPDEPWNLACASGTPGWIPWVP